MRTHPLGGLGRTQRAHADQDEGLPDEAESLDALHEIFEEHNIVTILRLDQLRTGGDFLREPLRSPFIWRHRRILGRSQEHPRRESNLAAALEMMLITQ